MCRSTIPRLVFFVVLLCMVEKSFGGTWGKGVFENDTALDFLVELYQPKSIGIMELKSKLKKTFIRSLDAPWGLDIPRCQETLAAARLFEAFHDKDTKDLPIDIKESVKPLFNRTDEFYLLSEIMMSMKEEAVTKCTDPSESPFARAMKKEFPKWDY